MLLRLFVVLLAGAMAMFAQYGTGVLLGTVTDQSSAVVAGAKVSVRNIETNEAREFVSDDSGTFQFNALPAGTYLMTVTAASFKSARMRVYTSFKPALTLPCSSPLYGSV